jgi:hypothetical protein
MAAFPEVVVVFIGHGFIRALAEEAVVGLMVVVYEIFVTVQVSSFGSSIKNNC